MVRVLEIVLDVARPQPSRENGDNASRSTSSAPALVRALTAALPQLVARSAEPEPVTTVLFDRDNALARAGWRVVVETAADAHQVIVSSRHAHTPGVTALTSILVAPLDASCLTASLFDAAPEPLRKALAAAGEPAPRATLCGERQRWHWPRDDIDVELVLDANLRDPNAASDSRNRDERASDSRELHELRLRAPWPDEADAAPIIDVLFACAHDLVDAAPADSPAFVRLADALARAAAGALASDAPAVHAEPVQLGDASTAEAALVAIGRNLSAHWLGNDAGVREAGKTEFIHQMRVSQRRLRTAMKIFSRSQDDVWITRIKPELKWLGNVLGEARDLDVFVESTLPMLAAADAADSAHADPARWDAIRAEADKARREARARAREAVASPRYAHLALAWLHWLATLAQRVDAAGARTRSLHEHATKRVKRYYARLADTQKLTAIGESERHQARINAKYLRYTLEFFAPIVSRRTRTKTARTLTRLQTVLGDGNDAAVALRFLAEMDIEPVPFAFARGWCEAVKLQTAKEGERLLRKLNKPKIARA